MGVSGGREAKDVTIGVKAANGLQRQKKRETCNTGESWALREKECITTLFGQLQVVVILLKNKGGIDAQKKRG